MYKRDSFDYECYGNSYSGPYGNTLWDIRLIYAFLLLIVIVLQFGRKPGCNPEDMRSSCNRCGCCCEEFCCNESYNTQPHSNQLIDNSVLFIIVFFMLVLCSGCFYSSWETW